MSKRIVILGGGILGLASAWHCLARGLHVTVIEQRSRSRGGCSFGNAGMVVPSHFIPLAAPGMVRLGMKWMWNPESPFSIEPRLSWELLAWLWRFQRACTKSHVERNMRLLLELNLAGRTELEELEAHLPGGFGMVRKGLLMLCKTEAAMREEIELVEQAHQLGLEAQVVDPAEAAALDPGIEINVRGGIYFPLDCHLNPARLMAALEEALAARGCEFLWDTACEGFLVEGQPGDVRAARSVNGDGQRVDKMLTTRGEVPGDEFVICGGAWSRQIASQLAIRLPLQAGKGYSLTLDEPRQRPVICSILKEARVAVTPIGDSLRFAGTMQITGTNESISQSKLRGIVRSIPEYFPQFREDDFRDCRPWVGLRPCSPDGLPYLGRVPPWSNLSIGTGHGMMGISLSMISGRIIAEAIEGTPHTIQGVERLSPARFNR